MQRLLSIRFLSNSNRSIISSSFPSSSSPLHLRHPHCLCNSASASSLSGPFRSQLGQLIHRHPDHGFIRNPLLLAWRRLQASAPPAQLRWFHSFDRNSGFGSISRSNVNAWRSWHRRLSTDNVVLGLVAANVVVFLLWQVADRGFMMRNFMISVDNIRKGYLHTMVTHAFSHMSIGHIVSNMLGLYFFGQHIGRVFGPEFLLKLYFAGAIGGAIFFLVYHAFSDSKYKGLFTVDPSRIPGLGASGAVNAIMLLDIFLFPKSTLMFEFIIPVPAILLGIYIIGKDMLRVIEGDPEVSGAAHLGGAAVAAIAWARVRRGRF
ncbi:hypothetical protein SAY87_003945 [Trapa incisa]|uniref:Peptidase S54 rhomboid domain-containing protein n=1 Tax=Trapa incisa TaxID=236973 RepID=A0AAN7JP94_9MYRT|nr:hypothetical protein SAY87_003945 [Trapa incisa]